MREGANGEGGPGEVQDQVLEKVGVGGEKSPRMMLHGGVLSKESVEAAHVASSLSGKRETWPPLVGWESLQEGEGSKECLGKWDSQTA